MSKPKKPQEIVVASTGQTLTLPPKPPRAKQPAMLPNVGKEVWFSDRYNEDRELKHGVIVKQTASFTDVLFVPAKGQPTSAPVRFFSNRSWHRRNISELWDSPKAYYENQLKNAKQQRERNIKSAANYEVQIVKNCKEIKRLEEIIAKLSKA
jgi:hypothetical protein